MVKGMATVTPSQRQIASLIAALGTDQFEDEALHFLQQVAGVEHYSVYRVRAGKPEFLGGASTRGRHAVRFTNPKHHHPRSYAELIHAQETQQDGAVLIHSPIESDEDPVLTTALRHFHIADRAMIYGRSDDDLYAVTVMRSEEIGLFTPAQIETLNISADLLIVTCAKHASLHWDRPRGVKIFESVEIIETKIKQAAWGLSVRELQVAARILFGISALGISIDLGLGEDTIATYRKRLYARLSIGSRHELMQKYLSLF
jgi:DNA-binding CsgD family transcriptional regulator